MKIHHIGIVVPNFESTLEAINKFLPFDIESQVDNVESQNVDVKFLSFNGQDVKIELIRPNEEKSPIKNFSQKNGGGFHHICYLVDDVEKTFTEMVSKGALPIVKPVCGFENRKTAFLFLPLKTSNCNLIELAQDNISIAKKF